MRVVAANAAPLRVGFKCGPGGAGVLIAEDHVIVHEVANGLHPRPTQRRMREQAPSLVGQTVGLAIAAPEQVQHGFRRQRVDLMLQSVQLDRIRHAWIADNGIGAEAETTRGGDQTGAPISETVAIAFVGNRRVRRQLIRTLQVGAARIDLTAGTGVGAATSAVRRPVNFDVPRGACDCHVHIFDPARLPYFSGRLYSPPEASIDDLRALQSALHFERVVVVTPSVYGIDNSCTVNAVRQLGARARGVAVIDKSISAAPLADMAPPG